MIYVSRRDLNPGRMELGLLEWGLALTGWPALLLLVHFVIEEAKQRRIEGAERRRLNDAFASLGRLHDV